MRAIRLGAAAVFVSGLGCSLLLSTAEPSQCTTDRDCDANPALRNRVCEEGFCVVPRASSDPVNQPGDGCTTTEICTQANSGKASVCKKAGGPCTPWQTEQCRFIAGDWKHPDPIVIGTILPFNVRQANGELVKVEYTERLQRAIDLGLEELTAEIPGGLPTAGGSKRPFAVLHCDSYFHPDAAKAAMTHLTDVVGASLVIVGGDRDLAAVRAQALDKKVPVVCSDCVAPFPAGPLAWRIVPPLVREAKMAAWRIGELEAQIKSGPNPPAEIKVAVLTSPEPGPTSFVSALAETLVFNGKSVAANGDAFTVRTTEDATTQAVIYVAHAEALAAFEPDILVVAMGAEFPLRYLQLLESKWTTAKPKPHYVMTALNFELTPFGVVGSDEDLRKRLTGTKPAFDQALQDNIDAFTIRYKLAYNYKPPDGNFSGYDAFYAAAYAIAAAAAQPGLDGPRIDQGFDRLKSGTTIDVGPKQLGLGLALLGAQSSTIDLRGLLSHMSWDPVTRDLVVDAYGLYCFERDLDGNLVLVDAGPRLDTATGNVTGVTSCD